jgi:hypothetical protein
MRWKGGSRRVQWINSGYHRCLAYRFLAFAGVAILVAAGATVPARAQTAAPTPKPKDDKAKNVAQDRDAKARESRPPLRKSPRGKKGCGSDATVPAPPSDGTLPRWTCAKSEVDIEPVWQGKQIECPFVIKNEGDADLHIKASGG